MVEGFDVASGAWSMLFREVEDARWEAEEVNGVHNRLELQTRFTPITSARALVYMVWENRAQARKELPMSTGSISTSHSSAAVPKVM